MGESCSTNEENYTREIYDKLSSAEYMTKYLGGRCPCSRFKNRISFSALGIDGLFLLKEEAAKFQYKPATVPHEAPKTLDLILTLTLHSDREKDAVIKTSQVLEPLGELNERAVNSIIKGFFVSSLKQFYLLNN